MVLFLFFDVIDDFIFFPNIIGKSPIALLPSLKAGEKTTLFHPNTTGDLDVFDIIGQGYGRVQVAKNMDMVFNAIDAVQLAIIVFDNTPNIFVKLFTMSLGDGWPSVFGTKYNLIVDLTKATHKISRLFFWKNTLGHKYLATVIR